MTGFRRPLGHAVLKITLATLALGSTAFAAPLPQDGVREDFEQGVELMRRGRDDEALVAFKRVLAADPSAELAWELFRDTDNQVWLEMLVKKGEWEQVGKRLSSLASQGQRQYTEDPDAIRALLRDIASEDSLAYHAALRSLSADHGAYAVPLMIGILADESADDRRVRYMQALSAMGDGVVLPLVEALDSPNAFQRRNVALTLGYIGDKRSAPYLAFAAQVDTDPGVRQAAAQALGKVGGGSAAAGFLDMGNAYHLQRADVLRPHQVTGVLWSWHGNRLEFTRVPAFLYHEELALKNYYRALTADPGSLEALSGIARAGVGVIERIQARDDADEYEARAESARLTVLSAGPAALDAALADALEEADELTAIGLLRGLQMVTPIATASLQDALRYRGNGALRGEAAVALAHASLAGVTASGSKSVGGEVLGVLTESAGREVVRTALIIDSETNRVAGLVSALEAQGIAVNARLTGAKGLASVYRLPGVDLILLADSLSDLTSVQVLNELQANPKTAETPVLMLTNDPDTVDEVFGDRVVGTIGSAVEMDSILAAFEGGLNRDRLQANALAARSARALADLAAAGTDISTAAGTLGTVVSGRPDSVALPAMRALAMAGGPLQAGPLAGVLADEDREEMVRVMAGQALSGIFSRTGTTSPEVVNTLTMVLRSGAPLPVRSAAAQALGQLDLSDEMRAGLMAAMRGM